ncbi:MAG: hypothetical protein AAGD96_08375 [Chloroflexota bacterium]
MTQPEQTDNLRVWLAQANPKLIMKLFMLFCVFGAVVTALIWLIFNTNIQFRSTLGFDQPVQANGQQPLLEQPSIIGLSLDNTDVSLAQSFNPPQTVEFGGYQLAISNQYLDAANLWKPIELNNTQIGWLENSVIHYIFRLPANRGFKDVLANLATKQESVTVHTAAGDQLTFKLNGVVDQIESQTITQAKPAITLIWLGENGEQLAVSGNYQPSAELLSKIDYRPEHLATSNTASQQSSVSVRLDAIDLLDNSVYLQTRGIITNRGADTLTISANDVSLQANGLVSQIVTADPPFPWTIPPNNSQIAFSLTLQRPPEAKAQLSIQNQLFELNFVRAEVD